MEQAQRVLNFLPWLRVDGRPADKQACSPRLGRSLAALSLSLCCLVGTRARLASRPEFVAQFSTNLGRICEQDFARKLKKKEEENLVHCFGLRTNGALLVGDQSASIEQLISKRPRLNLARFRCVVFCLFVILQEKKNKKPKQADLFRCFLPLSSALKERKWTRKEISELGPTIGHAWPQ